MSKIKKLFPFVAIFALLSCQSGEIHKTTVYVNFDYGNHIFITDPETGNEIPVAAPLLQSNYYNFGKEDRKKIPAIEFDYLIPGDRFYFEHSGSGDIICTESYPGNCYFEDGLLKSAKYIYTDVVEIDEESIIRNESGGIEDLYNFCAYDRYVIISSDLQFVRLDEYEGTTLFGSKDLSRVIPRGEKARTAPQPLHLGSLFAFNPRPSDN